MDRLSKIDVGLLRILAQSQKIINGQVRHYNSALKTSEEILPMPFLDGVITPKSLGELAARVFSYPLPDLCHYSRSNILTDAPNKEQVVQNRCIPIFRCGRKIYLVVSDPTQIQSPQRVTFASGTSAGLAVVSDDQLSSFLGWLEQCSISILKEISREQEAAQPIQVLHINNEEAEDGSTPRLTHKTLLDVLNASVPDIHFELYEQVTRARFRVDGQLREVVQPPVAVRGQLASRIRVMARSDISEKRVPQGGRTQIIFHKHGRPIDFRVSTLPTLLGEKMVVRILNSDAAPLNIDQLGFEPFQKEMLLEVIHRPCGMMSVTGPTGSDKAITLYTNLNVLNTEDVNISIAEDPVEVSLSGINQVNVNDKQGLTFATALKSSLHQGPDVIMIGETRDSEIVDTAIEATQTRHIVFSTLHTDNAPATLPRILGIDAAPFSIISSVSLIIAQRLLHCLYLKCKMPMERSSKLALLKARFTKEDLAKDWTVYRTVGCDSYRGKGYKDRAGVYKIVPVTEEMQWAIMNNGTEVDIMNMACKKGMVDLCRAGLLEVMRGLTTLEGVATHAND